MGVTSFGVVCPVCHGAGTMGRAVGAVGPIRPAPWDSRYEIRAPDGEVLADGVPPGMLATAYVRATCSTCHGAGTISATGV